MTETVTGVEPAIADLTPVETAVTADAAPAVTDADEATAGKPPVQKRIDELTRLRRDAERERDYWHEQAMRQPQAKPDAAEPDAPKKAPALADFDFDEAKYQAALAAHITEEATRKVREEFRKEQAELTATQRREAFSKREREFATKHADYMDLTRDSSIPLNTTIVELARDAENGVEILYYLANNPDEAMGIAQMDERSAARAIGRIESKLEKPATPAPPPKPVSKAPPPPPQIEAVEPAVSKDPSEMSDAEFAKWRKRQIAQRR